MKDREKRKKLLFYAVVALSFFTIWIYNILTPQLSDDLVYQDVVREGTRFLDIFRQEYIQYMNWTGRSVNHIILRTFLWGDKWVFDLCNSLVFVGLLLLMYAQVERRGKYNSFLYLFLTLLVWMGGVDFGQTVLWETGACNYLWGTAIILGAVTLYRSRLERYEREGTDRRGPLWTLLLFFTGVAAGWCNENTSGGGLLLMLSFLAMYLYRNKKERKGLRPWMVSAPLGMLTGFCFMVFAPGNAVRSAMKGEEGHAGLLGLAARLLKIVLAVKEEFLLLILFFIVLLAVAWAQKLTAERMVNTVRFALVSLATSFALLLAPDTQARAHFGAGIFLLIALAQCFLDVEERETVYAAAKRALVGCLCFLMVFTYVEEGANLMRIQREVEERDAYIWAERNADEEHVTAPMLRPDWRSPYSFAYDCDITQDSEYWVNQAYAQHYLLFSLTGAPREEWEAERAAK